MDKEKLIYQEEKKMDPRHLKSTQNVHALGVRYVSNFLHRVGFTIHEVNTDPDHHFQLLTKRKNRTMLINVRTAYYLMWELLIRQLKNS